MTSLRPPILAAAATLSDLTRCRILRALERHELTVSELCTILQLPQSTVSRHLKVLADLDWLRVRREGTSHLYQQDRLSDSDGRLWGLIRDQLAVGPHAEEDEARLERVLEERRSRSEEFFASTAGQWDLLRDELFGTRFDLLALAGFLGPSWVVADLACGTGRVAEALAPFVGRLIAIDGSRAMLKAARARLGRFDNISVRTGSLEQVPVEDDSLDAATLFLALHHIGDPECALREAGRVLRPGGRLVVVDMMPHERENYRQEMGHVWLGFGEAQITRYLAAAGFEEIRYTPLPAASEAKGPSLFVACATAAGQLTNSTEVVVAES